MNLADDARTLTARTRAAQGLPEHIEDAAILDKVAVILTGARRDSAPVHQAGAPVNNTITITTATSATSGRSGSQHDCTP